MKVRTVLAIASFSLFAAVACAPGAGAETPPDVTAGPGSNGVGQATNSYPTATPWPQFGPPPVTVDSIAATVQAAPGAPDESSEPQATAVPTATPAPGFVDTENGVATVVASPPKFIGTSTPPDVSSTFEPHVPYSFNLPLDWVEIVGDDEIVLGHSTGRAQVSMRERYVDRSLFDSVIAFAQSEKPLPFIDWSERSLFDIRYTGSNSIRQQFAGTKLGEPHIAVVDWYLWGDLLIEVVTEARASAWAEDTNLHNTALLLAAAFATDSGVSVGDLAEIELQLLVRFNDKSSNIFTRTPESPAQTELSCRQVLLDLLSTPVYAGSGEWQVFTVTETGVQVWQIFEPSYTIVPAAHNTSAC